MKQLILQVQRAQRNFESVSRAENDALADSFRDAALGDCVRSLEMVTVLVARLLEPGGE